MRQGPPIEESMGQRLNIGKNWAARCRESWNRFEICIDKPGNLAWEEEGKTSKEGNDKPAERNDCKSFPWTKFEVFAFQGKRHKPADGHCHQCGDKELRDIGIMVVCRKRNCREDREAGDENEKAKDPEDWSDTHIAVSLADRQCPIDDSTSAKAHQLRQNTLLNNTNTVKISRRPITIHAPRIHFTKSGSPL